ncbi:energy transducer TonB [Aureisphaera galaxeae]|uniref:energy transducer TonB n=1 Tax=Aureisphaera galaxeae TaxID=1538023 RepID=UPI0023500B67|nr:energy transducer TonB [Aureisphaera galaxeae]MDC8003661.1 energy transducer TonB [Aureisphaera galaxeae]
MKLKVLLWATLFTGLLAHAQNLDELEIMGEWNVLSVYVPDQVKEKEAVTMMKDAFTGAKFNFRGDRVFEIKLSEKADERFKELFFLNGENWIIQKSQVLIGTEEEGFSTMHITVQEQEGKTYFMLPMMGLQVEKISNDTPRDPKMVKSKKKKQAGLTDTDVVLIQREIDENLIVPYAIIQDPPLAPGCKSKWDTGKKKKCTSLFIQQHLQRKFNTELANDLGISGTIRIAIEFVIDSDGKVVNITANGGPEEMNENAILSVGKLPQLKPGQQDGTAVPTSYRLPLQFTVVD